MTKVPLTYNAFYELLLEDSERGMKAVGRALVALTNLQTQDEIRARQSRHHNNKGFSGVDARIGQDNAEYFITNGFLNPIQLRYWRKADKHGNVRICKYIEQLLEVAKTKAGYVDKPKPQEPQAVQLRLPL